MKNKRNTNNRVVTEIEDTRGDFAAGGKKLMKKIGSKSFGSITKTNVFIISLITAVAVNIVIDLIILAK